MDKKLRICERLEKNRGGRQLFLSSYLLYFIIEIIKTAVIFSKITCWTNAEKIFIVFRFGFFFSLFICSILIALSFIRSINKQQLSKKKSIEIEEISQGAGEAIAYYVSYIVPLLNYKVELNIIWYDLVLSVIWILLLGILFSRTFLIIVNPTLMLCGLRFYKISCCFSDVRGKKIRMKGILIAKWDIHPEDLKNQTRISVKGDFIFIYKDEKKENE